MRIEEERKRRAQCQRRIGAVRTRRVGAGGSQKQFRRWNRSEDLCKTAKLDGNDHDRGKRREVDQDVLDDGDRGRRPEPARIGESREDDERNDQRQITGIARAGNAQASDHDLQPDELQRNVWQRRDDAGDRHCEREPTVAEASADEVGCGDVVVAMADVPEPREGQEKDRIGDDGVGDGEKRDRARAEGQRRNGDESVGGVKVAADQEPGDEGAEATSAKAPFVQLIKVAFAPMRGGKPKPGYEGKQGQENEEGGPVHVLHGTPPVSFPRYFVLPLAAASAARSAATLGLLLGREIDNGGQDGSNDDPEELIPIEERHAEQGRLGFVVEWGPEHRDELNEKEQVPPAPSCALAELSIHMSSHAVVVRRKCARRPGYSSNSISLLAKLDLPIIDDFVEAIDLADGLMSRTVAIEMRQVRTRFGPVGPIEPGDASHGDGIVLMLAARALLQCGEVWRHRLTGSSRWMAALSPLSISRACRCCRTSGILSGEAARTLRAVMDSANPEGLRRRGGTAP